MVQVRKAIADNLIRHVSAFVVEGMADVVIRHYATDPADLSKMPLNKLTEEEFRALFVGKTKQIVIDPVSIIKFRTVAIGLHSQTGEEWAARKQAISELLPKQLTHTTRRTLMRQIALLSQDWDDQRVPITARHVLASTVFLPEQEIVPPTLAYQPGRNSIRQVFVLLSGSIGDPNDDQRRDFENKIIGRLMDMPEIRSIYRIREQFDDVAFDYWLDIVGEIWRVRDIILDLDQWGHDLSVTCGTRSMGVLDYLLLDSVDGIYATDLESYVDLFLSESKRIDPGCVRVEGDYVSAGMNNFLEKWCYNWYHQDDEFRGDDVRELKRKLTVFYVSCFWGNVTRDTETAKTYLEKAGDAWESLYKEFERRWDSVLRQYFSVGPNDDMWPLARAHLSRLGVNDKELQFIRAKSFDQVMHLAHGDASFTYLKDVDVSAMAHAHNEHVTRFRNDVTHGRSVKSLGVRDPGTGEPDTRVVDRIIEATRHLIESLNVAEECLAGVGLRKSAA